MSTIINPNYNSQARQVELNKQKILEILEKITNLFTFNGNLGNQSTTILKSNIIDVNKQPNIGDFIIDKDNNLFQITGDADTDNFYGTFVSNIQGPKGEQGEDGLSLGNNAWCFNYTKSFSVPSNNIVTLYCIDIDTDFNFTECQIGDLVIFYNGTSYNTIKYTGILNIGHIVDKFEREGPYISVKLLTHTKISSAIGKLSRIGTSLTQDASPKIGQDINGNFNISNHFKASGGNIDGAAIEFDTTLIYSLPLKGSDKVAVDIAQDNKSIEVKLDSQTINDLNRTLKSPVTPPTTTQIVAIDSTGNQVLLTLGEGLTIENGVIKAVTV